LSNSLTEPKSPISDESVVVKQYKVLIDKLIPLQQENRLLEGLNKFSNKLPSRVRNIIKGEVIRLTSLTDASADNSEFAKFPMLKFKHFGIPMRLDKVGQEILSRETERFADRYTVGVFESLMSSDSYQSHVKREQQEKIAKAFKVESQSFSDIDFAGDLAIRPNYTVSCPEFENGKQCTLASLSRSGIVVITKRAPAIGTESEPGNKLKPEKDNVFIFSFPKVVGMNDKATEIKFEMLASSFNKDMSVFETCFNFAASTPKKLIERWNKYIENSVNQFPLERELEIERVLQNLERDRILANSPWIPVFLSEQDGHLCPLYELSTPKNTEYNEHFNVIKNLPSQQIFQNLIKELLIHKETFLLNGKIEAKNSHATVAVTHRQLAKTGLMKQFIELATQSEQLNVVQFRLQPLAEEHKKVAFDIHDIIASEYPDLNTISHVLFCKDVTSWVGDLKIQKPEPFKPFPRAIIDDQTRWPIKVVMESDADRRLESRYLMNAPAKISTGLFNQFDATLNDLSSHGLKLTLDNPSKGKFDDTVKISIKEIKLRGQKYEVVHYDLSTGVLRLKLPSADVQNEGQKFQNLFSNNAQYFNQRDLSVKQRNIHRFLWELSIRNQPCASVLITNNRFNVDRLKTVYHKDDCFDLKPFGTIGNEVPMHGFFADKDAKGPKSQLLESMLCQNQRDAHVIHVVRAKDQRIIFVNESEFLFGKVRNQISEHISKKAIDVCVSHLSAMRCSDSNTPLTEKRLAQISKIDIDIYKKLKSMQKGYTHVMYVTNVSIFHNVLLGFGVYPEAEQSD
jgi:hypothetical protein